MEKKILLRLDQKVAHNVTILAARNHRSINEEMSIALKAWSDVGLTHDITDITDINSQENIPGSYQMQCVTCYRATYVCEPCSHCAASLCATCYREDHCLLCDIQGQEIPF